MNKPVDRLAEIRDIKEKCEQYWNEPNIPDAEIHAALEFIYSKAATLNSIIDARDKELEQVKAERDAAKKRIDRAMEWLDNGEPLAAVYSVLQGSKE